MTLHRSHPAWRTAFAVLVAAMLSGCAGMTITPVDHSCPTNPQSMTAPVAATVRAEAGDSDLAVARAGQTVGTVRPSLTYSAPVIEAARGEAG